MIILISLSVLGIIGLLDVLLFRGEIGVFLSKYIGIR